MDKSCDFFLTKDSWEAVILFRVGSLGDAPSLLERLDVEKPQGRQAVRNGTRISASGTTELDTRECAEGLSDRAGG